MFGYLEFILVFYHCFFFFLFEVEMQNLLQNLSRHVATQDKLKFLISHIFLALIDRQNFFKNITKMTQNKICTGAKHI